MGEKQKKNAGRWALIYSGFCTAVCLVLVLVAVFAGSKNLFAWFSQTRAAHSNNQSLSVFGQNSLLIRRTSGGVDLNDMNPQGRLSFSASPEGGVISPGLTGAYDAYIVCTPGLLNSSYNLQISCSVVEDTTNPLTNGFRSSKTTAAERERVFQLFQGHIAFFQHYDGTTYSGWIEPGTGVSQAMSEESLEAEEQHITIYWMWLETYEQLLGIDNNLIAQEDCQRMVASAEANPSAWFFGSNYETLTQKTNEYNSADVYLASLVESVSFRTEFAVT